MKLEWTPIKGERSRTYIFANGAELVINRVSRICVRPTNHRIETALGEKYIVSGKFIAIRIDAERWSA